MVEALSLIAIILSVIAVAAILIVAKPILCKVRYIESNKEGVALARKQLDAIDKSHKEMLQELDDLKAEFATAKALMFAYEADLKVERGVWCLEHKGDKKWYKPGVLLRTESANGKNVTEFSYDDKDGNVTAVSKKDGKLVSSVTFSKFGSPIAGKVYANGVESKTVSYDKLGQVLK